MIELKDYQKRVLKSLSAFFRRCVAEGRPDGAYKSVLIENGWKNPAQYHFVEAEGELNRETPYVCLRVPTGGGKTLLACHAAGTATQDLLNTDRSVVLWLVPSNTILNQTADALRDPRHPYRQALEQACGEVEILTIDEALRLTRASVDGQTVVIVATIQAFRVEDTSDRKVYESSGSLPEHFLNIPAERLRGLLLGADGKPTPSLVNVLRLHRPIVIVDEAHNARTELSFSTLAKVRPACIIEFTATPDQTRHRSNVLHYVSAAELKAADMIKLPVRVITRHPSQRDELLADAVKLRSDLNRFATAEGQITGEYIRPILLIQAENIPDCEPLREKLVAEYGFTREAVKISTGKLDDLEGVKDITSPQCPVTVIITVQKLREGWDCPFAYVLCSLKVTRSSTALEQITGRVLRLPRAKAKRHPELNNAYVFSISPSIGEVLAELREALVANGFSKSEADINIQLGVEPLPLWSQNETIQLAVSEIDTAMVKREAEKFVDKVDINPVSGEVVIHVPLDASTAKLLEDCILSPEAKGRVQEAIIRVTERDKLMGGNGEPRPLCPYEKQMEFKVPRLCVNENGKLFEFESSYLFEYPWKLSQKDASLSPTYNPLERPKGQLGEVDIGEKGELSTAMAASATGGFIAELQQQAMTFSAEHDWTMERLVAWLDHKIEHGDIPVSESAEFIRKAIRGLMAKFSISNIDLLAADRFRLRQEIENRIDQHRTDERKSAFQTFMLSEHDLSVVPQNALNFKTSHYEPSWLYTGPFVFRKHYFGNKPGELKDETEEFICAQYLDAHPKVKYWARNLSRKPSSFRLQTSKDWFYPDFVCLLEDGRTLVVEYKGSHLFADAEEKRVVGKVWEKRSEGLCLFSMPTNKDFSELEVLLA